MTGFAIDPQGPRAFALRFRPAAGLLATMLWLLSIPLSAGPVT